MTRVAESGVVLDKRGLFLTVTAPGAREHYVGHTGEVCRCGWLAEAGDLARYEDAQAKGVGFGRDLRPQPYRREGHGTQTLASWNAGAGKAFNHLMRNLERELTRVDRRRDPGAPAVKLIHFKGTEVQKKTRHALHYHVLVRRADGRPLAISTTMFRRLAIEQGFGHSVDVKPWGAFSGAYVAKYVSKSVDERKDVPWWGWRPVAAVREVDDDGRVHWRRPKDGPKLRRADKAAFRTWSASWAWGDSMGSIKAAQRHWTMCLIGLPPWQDRGYGASWWADVDSDLWEWLPDVGPG